MFIHIIPLQYVLLFIIYYFNFSFIYILKKKTKKNMDCMSQLTGSLIHVTLKDGEIYEGILKHINAEEKKLVMKNGKSYYVT